MKTELDEKTREHYKQRLAHFLKSYRDRNSLSQIDVAKQLGYALDHYKRLENALEDRIANCIEFLTNFANLDFHGDYVDFLIYLRNERKIEQVTDSLYPWEKKLLESFNELPGDERREFMSQYCGKEKKGPWKLGDLVALSRDLSRLEENDRLIIEVMIALSGKRKLSECEKELFIAAIKEKL